MAKHNSKAKPLNPAIRLSGLRQRLNNVLGVANEPQATVAQIDQLTEGLKPTAFLPIVVSASGAAGARSDLDAPLVNWMQQAKLLGPLSELVARAGLDEGGQQLALRWLEAANFDTASLRATLDWNAFYRAYQVGNEFQAAVAVFWYTSPQRRRVRALSLLLDFEPPWEGALKDVAVLGQRSPDEAINAFFDLWRGQGGEPRPLTASEAQQAILVALGRNREQGIRLPADVIGARELFLSMMGSLASAESGAEFGAAEFDALATSGRRPEDLRLNEQIGGYQTRTPNGDVILLPPLSDDEL